MGYGRRNGLMMKDIDLIIERHGETRAIQLGGYYEVQELIRLYKPIEGKIYRVPKQYGKLGRKEMLDMFYQDSQSFRRFL